MADAKKAEAAEGTEAPEAPKKKLLLFIIIGVVVLVLGGGGAAFFLTKKGSHADEEAVDGEEAPAKVQKAKKAKKDDKEAPPVFVKLDPFTVKLQSEGGESYLQTTPELRVLDAPLGDKIKQFTPEIRHRVLLILSAKKSADVATAQGVQQLSNEIRVAINRIIDGPKEVGKGKKKAAAEAPASFPDEADPEDSVQAVLFTSFIVQ
ncbi:MAG: flagellar basal body-associated FliL family protein [Sulfurisoma sp.]|nr:flagellar basal body-associated FliL family protein [Sulfurisoma sp.]